MSFDVGGNRSTRRKPTQTRGELANSTQKGRDSNPGPSCCKATALTTAPPCCPYSIVANNCKFQSFNYLVYFIAHYTMIEDIHHRSPVKVNLLFSLAEFGHTVAEYQKCLSSSNYTILNDQEHTSRTYIENIHREHTSYFFDSLLTSLSG